MSGFGGGNLQLIEQGALVNWRGVRFDIAAGGSGDNRLVVRQPADTSYINMTVTGGNLVGGINMFNRGGYYLASSVDISRDVEFHLTTNNNGYLRTYPRGGSSFAFTGLTSLSQFGDEANTTNEGRAQTRIFTTNGGNFTINNYSPTVIDAGAGTQFRVFGESNNLVNLTFPNPNFDLRNMWLGVSGVSGRTSANVLINSTRTAQLTAQLPTLARLTHGTLLFHQDVISNFEVSTDNVLTVARGVDGTTIQTPTTFTPNTMGEMSFGNISVARNKKRQGTLGSFNAVNSFNGQPVAGVTTTGHSQVISPEVWYSNFALGNRVEFQVILNTLDGTVSSSDPIDVTFTSPEDLNINSDVDVINHVITADEVTAGQFTESDLIAGRNHIVRRFIGNNPAATAGAASYVISGGTFTRASSSGIPFGDGDVIQILQDNIPGTATTWNDAYDMIHKYITVTQLGNSLDDVVDFPLRSTLGSTVGLGTHSIQTSTTSSTAVSFDSSASTWTIRSTENHLTNGPTFNGINVPSQTVPWSLVNQTTNITANAIGALVLNAVAVTEISDHNINADVTVNAGMAFTNITASGGVWAFPPNTMTTPYRFETGNDFSAVRDASGGIVGNNIFYILDIRCVTYGCIWTTRSSAYLDGSYCRNTEY